MIVFVFGDTQLGPEHRAAVRAHLRRQHALALVIHAGTPGAGALARDEALGEFVRVGATTSRRRKGESARRYVGRLVRQHGVDFWLLFHLQTEFVRGGASELLEELRRRKLPGQVVLLWVDGGTRVSWEEPS